MTVEMGDQSDDILHLNTYVGPPGVHRNRSKRSFTQKSRSKRIKARRHEKLKKEQESPSPSSVQNVNKEKITAAHSPSVIKRSRESMTPKLSEDKDNNVNSVPSNSTPGKRKLSETDSANNAKKQKVSGPVISSLFRNNPVIPLVTCGTTQRRKEDLFSSEKFSDLGLHPFMVSNLEEKMKLTKMTSVQQKAIPHVMMGSDTLVKSQTGSGKTLAFAIPIVQGLQAIRPKIQRANGPYALIIVPSRELALQCFDTIKKLVQSFLWIVPGCITGGENRKAEKARIRKGMNIIVGTPGRLLDHITNTDSLALTKVHWLIIDEADRLLDMGYEKDIAQIINALNSAPTVDGTMQEQRQTVLLSATLTDDVKKLAGMSLKNPVTVDLSPTANKSKEEPSSHKTNSVQSDTLSEANGTDQLQTSTQTVFSVPEKLEQNFIITPCKLRLVSLAAFIMLKCKLKNKPGKMLVFMSTQDTVDFHFRLFKHFFGGGLADTELDMSDVEVVERDDSLNVFKLHGAMEQKERVDSYQKFCRSDTGVMLCTDVACRGLDLPNVKWIVQYTSPGVAIEYIQRVGRTARAGKVGHSTLFLMPSEVDYLKYLNGKDISLEELKMSRLLKILPVVVLDHLPSTDSQRQLPRSYEEASTYIQMAFENFVQGRELMQNLAKKAFQSYVRAYATYPSELKSIFHIKGLHLGHLAKSFALRDAPSEIYPGSKGQMSVAKKKTKNRLSFDKSGSGKKSHLVSEFDSGLHSGKLSKPNKRMNSKLKNKKKRKK